MPGRASPESSDAGWVAKQHKFAKGLYGLALEESDRVEAVFKAEWAIPNDTADTLTNSGPRVTHPARARAIVEKFLTLLSVQATMDLNVLPKKLGTQEQAACTKLENWLVGYQRQYMMETKRLSWRNAVYWYLLRGRCVIQTFLDPAYLNTDYLALRTRIPDPNTVFTVWGENGIGWYTTEEKRYVWEIKQELELRKGRGKDKWQPIDLPDDENELVTVVQYWDKEYNALCVHDQMVWLNHHEYDFVNISEAHCMDTPLADMRWAYNSVLSPILDSLKQQYALASKMATGVDLFYWPKILVQSASGATVMLDSGAPGVESYIPPDAKVTVIAPTPNAQVLAQSMAWFKADEQLGAIPEIAWGSEPTSLQSGFAISQVLTAIMDKIVDKKTYLQAGFGWDFGHKLKLVEKYGDLEGANLTVPTYADDPSTTGKKRSTLLSITPQDVDGRHWVEVVITPELPHDRMLKAQLAQAYRAPGTDGRPLMDDQTVIEVTEIVTNPNVVKARIDAQMLVVQSPEIQRISLLAAEQQWLDENKAVIKLAEQRQSEQAHIEALAKQMAQQMVAQQLAQMGVQTPQAAAMAGMPPPEVPLNGNTPVAPGGPSPEILPSQMSGAMTPEQAIPTEPNLTMKQNLRLGNPPRPNP